MSRADKKLVVALHFTFWLLFLSFKFIDYNQNLPVPLAFKLVGVQNGFNIIASYLHYFFLLPMLLERKKYGLYSIYLLAMMSVIIFARMYSEGAAFAKLFGTDYYTTINALRAFNILWTTMSFVLFTSLMKFTMDRFVLEGEKKNLENEKLNAELNYLKAQINPHFLFNTLHNLNYLTQVKSDQATEVTVKLSNIMRYMIYESDKPLVPLRNEIGYIRDYLDLEKIRLNKEFDLTFDTRHVYDGVEIPPLILIPFVENAFKHGVSDANSKSRIHMKLESQEGHLKFSITNSLNEQALINTEQSGFGLNNVRKRLNLSFQDRHKLDIVKTEVEFRVTLDLVVG